MRVQTKRIYEESSASDGQRILIDRLWPRGVSKERAAVDLWVKELAPSHALRTWYRHDPEKWPEFRRRYFAELESNAEQVAELLSNLSDGTVTLVYSSKETRLNNATAFKQFLEREDL